MTELSFKKNEKQWAVYHKWEKKYKMRYLRKLSEADGFRILEELHRFVCKMGTKPSFAESDMSKIKLLAKVHSLFNKIK